MLQVNKDEKALAEIENNRTAQVKARQEEFDLRLKAVNETFDTAKQQLAKSVKEGKDLQAKLTTELAAVEAERADFADRQRKRRDQDNSHIVPDKQ